VNHVAIDLGSKESQVCMRSPDGMVVWERKHRTAELPKLLRNWEHSRVILETASEAFRIADAARAAGHEVRVVPSVLAKQLGIGERGIKTDRRDALKLSEVSCRVDLPSVHIPSPETRELRSMLRSRATLIASRTQLINHVRGWIRTQVGRLRKGTTTTLPTRVRDLATEHSLTIPPHIEQILAVLVAIGEQIKAAEAAARARAKNDPICRRLMTVPGIGPITSLSFVASIETTTRFPLAHHVQSYLGLTAGENSSSERQRRTGITKAGSSLTRGVLVQAAWTALRRYPKDPMVRWAMQIMERRGKHIAVVALARKLCGVMFALWRDETTYVPSRSAAPMAPPST
jgi:transposase